MLRIPNISKLYGRLITIQYVSCHRRDRTNNFVVVLAILLSMRTIYETKKLIVYSSL